jgi:hypothetical protein
MDCISDTNRSPICPTLKRPFLQRQTAQTVSPLHQTLQCHILSDMKVSEFFHLGVHLGFRETRDLGSLVDFIHFGEEEPLLLTMLGDEKDGAMIDVRSDVPVARGKRGYWRRDSEKAVVFCFMPGPKLAYGK